MFDKQTVLSSLPDAINYGFLLLKANILIESSWKPYPLIFFSSYPVLGFHTLIVLSADAVTTNIPSGVKLP